MNTQLKRVRFQRQITQRFWPLVSLNSLKIQEKQFCLQRIFETNIYFFEKAQPIKRIDQISAYF